MRSTTGPKTNIVAIFTIAWIEMGEGLTECGLIQVAIFTIAWIEI